MYRSIYSLCCCWLFIHQSSAHHHSDNEQAFINLTSPLDSNSYHHQRSHRSVPEFEATLNAMKCALRIVGLQVSEHHNNMFMCCGLWKMKSFMKDTADRVCENAHESKRVFDDFMTDELIYGKFTHSILGDDTLDCKKYPEGSPTCERLFAIITFIIVMVILSILLLAVSCCMATVCWHKSRRQYQVLLRLKLTDQDCVEKDQFLRNHYDEEKTRDKRKNWAENLKVLIPGQKYEMKQPRRTDRLNNLSFQQQRNELDSSGKSSPDSAVPLSTNSTTTSRNTSTMTLNDNHQHAIIANAATLEEKHK